MTIEWTESAERRCREIAQRLRTRHENAEQEARWVVELELHRALTHRLLRQAQACATPEEKRALVARWRGEYSRERVEEVLAILRDPERRARVLATWGPTQ